MIRLSAFILATGLVHAQTYDLLLKGGHVIDPRNNIDGPRDVAISGRTIARVAADIPASQARRVANVSGLYVTPGLIDIHVHVYTGTGNRDLTGDQSVYPDGFTFESGVTTVVDAGTSGFRNFPDFKQRVIDRSQTRVLALINIAANGMQGENEHDASDMKPEPLAEMAKQHPQIVVGVKTAHYRHKDWTAVENAVKAGTLADIPVMVDFGSNHPERPIRALFMEKLRPGDIYTHAFSGLRDELLPDGKINPAMFEGRKRGIIFDMGHGSGSFAWNVASAAFQQNFPPDTISSDLHTGSMNGGMKDMTNMMSKIRSEGVPLKEVVRMSSWRAAQVIKRPQYGNLSEGAGADIAVLREIDGKFGYLDVRLARKEGTKKILCEMTVRDGRVVYDLNGLASLEWRDYYRNEPGRGGRKK
ncbi:MAG: amidohydrolase/deacetylase family metallohydrolase [Acidobacteria bacterium]|nr:amidohydrolase/deacetylase family metallohydrolase [Acidobacteriota bacterium]